MKTSILVLSTFLFLGSCSEKEDLESPISEENTYTFTFNNKKYEVVKESKTWQEAADFAVKKGGFLAEINNSDEQNAIFTELTTKAGLNLASTKNEFGFAAIWLGGNDLGTEGKWLWDGDNNNMGTQFWEGGVSGNAINGLYNNWGNEPDNRNDQDVLCIGIENTPINASGKWTDLDGNVNKLFFVIEYN